MLRFHLLILIIVLPTTGCKMLRQEKAGKYETTSAALHCDSKKAADKNRRAIIQLEGGNCDKAKALVEEALIAEVNHAPSHNTIGRIQFQLNDDYLAAWEFEFALKTSPDTAEYHNNLGLVYEAADRGGFHHNPIGRLETITRVRAIQIPAEKSARYRRALRHQPTGTTLRFTSLGSCRPRIMLA